MFALFPGRQKLGPRLVRLADEDHVRQPFERFRLDGGHRPADDGHRATRTDLFQNLDETAPLDIHAGETHEVGSGQTVEVDVLDILVDERHVVMIRHQCREETETSDRQIGLLPEQGHTMLKPPKRDVETRIDDDDIGHEILPLRAILSAIVTRLVKRGDDSHPGTQNTA